MRNFSVWPFDTISYCLQVPLIKKALIDYFSNVFYVLIYIQDPVKLLYFIVNADEQILKSRLNYFLPGSHHSENDYELVKFIYYGVLSICS